MITSEIESNTVGGLPLSTSQSNVMDKDDFLNLLVTQLQHQDPLNPTDSVEFTAQLAQFSSLEQLGNVNDNLSDLKMFQASLNNSQAVALIDKSVTAEGNSLELSDSGQTPCNFELEDDAATVAISIYDHTGNYVAEIDCENLQAGRHALPWDGTDLKGNPVTAGKYSFEVLAENARGQTVRTTTLVMGIVDRVVFENNATYLISGNQKIALGDVIQVAASGEAQAAAQEAPIAAEPKSMLRTLPNYMINGGK